MEFFGSINAIYVLVGSLFLGAAAGMLGAFAVLRKQGLMGDALAHASLPGIALAFLIVQTKFLPVLLAGALVSGLIGAFCISYLVKNTKIKMDTAMAAVLSVFFGIGILLLSYIQKLPLASQSGLESFLFGQAAAILRTDVIWMGVAFFAILAVVLVFWKELKMFTFDAEFAKVVGFRGSILEMLFMTIFVVSVLMSLQAVGVVLTAALFITPAVAALLWSDRMSVVVFLSSVFGMASGGIGAYLSAVFENMPTGPVIVLVSTAIFFASFLFAPGRGAVSRWISYRRSSQKMKMENVLGELYRDVEKGTEKWDKVRMAWLLKRKGYLKAGALTDSGMKAAAAVVEKHRLWETYLVNRWHLEPDHVHRDADEMEHVLTDEMVEKLHKILDNPTEDPHGKPIKT